MEYQFLLVENWSWNEPQMIVVEPVLTAEKLNSLLNEAHEQSGLDYKRQLNLAETRDVVELAKDAAAMMSEELGGYIVFGADDAGKPVADLTDTLAKLFDEATVRPKLAKYIDAPFEVRTARHTIQGCNLVLLYVAPHRDGWCVFRAIGNYLDGKVQKTVFTPGDVFVRHGTSSERWNATDQQRLIGRIVERRKEAWRMEQRKEFASLLTTGIAAAELERGPASLMSWRLDAEAFDQLATELMRRNDAIPLRQMLLRSIADVPGALSSPGDFATLLDRIASLGALALTYEQHEWFSRAVEALVQAYSRVENVSGSEAARAWMMTMTRAYGLGGLSVRLKNWKAVRQLAVQQAEGPEFSYYRSWSRHAITMASRAQIINEGQNGLIDGARNVVREVAALRIDVDSESEKVLDSLCQFDALVALSVIDEASRISSSDFYTNFARYYEHRTQPIFSRIIRDEEMRAAIFSGTDKQLAEAISAVDKLATSEGFRYGYDGINDQAVNEFIAANRASK
ncbi:AlbA family DNA-binding domain-containing protein [Longispora urticae]